MNLTISEVAPVKGRFVRMIYSIIEIADADNKKASKEEFRTFKIHTTCLQGSSKFLEVRVHKNSVGLIRELQEGRNKWFEFSPEGITPAHKPSS